MAQSKVETQTLTVRVTDVQDVAMSEIVASEGGGWVREFRIFGTGEDPDADPPLIFILRLEAASKAVLEVTTPPLQL